MENEIKISIIMPVYGVEKYVAKAIESIIAQTFTDWEFIIVDDGAKDRSPIICDEYAKKDPRIKVIHKENGGASSARNLAISMAKGKYLYFIDADDWTQSTMLEDMFELAEKNNLQYVITGFYIDTYYSDREYLTQELSQPDEVFASREDFRQNAYRLFDSNLLYTPWNKLFLTQYIKEKNIVFPNTFWDDFPFNLCVLEEVERVAVSSKKYYHFIRARAESETAKYRPEMYQKREEEHRWLVDLYKKWGIDDENSREFLARRYIERFIGCVENLTNADCRMSAKQKMAEINKMLGNPNVSESVKRAKPHSLYMKIMLLPVRWNSTLLLFIESLFISFVKRKFTKIFSQLKASR